MMSNHYDDDSSSILIETRDSRPKIAVERELELRTEKGMYICVCVLVHRYSSAYLY
jgi:hypothetical protein